MFFTATCLMMPVDMLLNIINFYIPSIRILQSILHYNEHLDFTDERKCCTRPINYLNTKWNKVSLQKKSIEKHVTRQFKSVHRISTTYVVKTMRRVVLSAQGLTTQYLMSLSDMHLSLMYLCICFVSRMFLLLYYLLLCYA